MTETEYKKIFSTNLRRIMKEREKTQVDIISTLSLNKSTVSSWVNGVRMPRMDKIDALATFLNTTRSNLLEDNTNSPRHSSKKGVRIPVLGNVAAGTPIEAIANEVDLNDSDNWEEIEESIAATGNFFALKIKGQSMEPRIKEDDIVIVRQQPDVESGNLAVVYINGYDATVKEIKKLPSGIMLIGWNRENYEPHFYTYEETKTLPIKIIGKVIELRAKF